MSLKNCRECGKDVSSEAATCPHCGALNPWITSEEDVERERRIDERWRPYIVAYWVVGLGIVGVSYCILLESLGPFGLVPGLALVVAWLIGFVYVLGFALDEKGKAWEEAFQQRQTKKNEEGSR